MNGLPNSSLETDDLITDLFRRKSFDSLLSKEFQAASKDNPLAVVMIDIDHFKKVNDTYGHQQGDRALKEIGKILSDICNRGKGYAARYGGEELVLILPNFTFKEAKAVTERVCSTIDNHSFQGVDDKSYIHCTASAGISVYPDAGAQTEEELIRQADEALYEAKRNGRNQVCLASSAVITSEQRRQLLSLEVEYIPDGSKCYLLRDSQFLLVVVRLKFTNRINMPTTVKIRPLDIQIDNSWEIAERTSHNETVQELRANISVKNQDWLEAHEDIRLEARDTRTVYPVFLLPKRVRSDIKEVQVGGIVEDMDGGRATFEAIIPRFQRGF